VTRIAYAASEGRERPLAAYASFASILEGSGDTVAVVLRRQSHHRWAARDEPILARARPKISEVAWIKDSGLGQRARTSPEAVMPNE